MPQPSTRRGAKNNDMSHRSIFKLSIRDDNSIHFNESRRGKSMTERTGGERITESSSRYLQRHLAHRYE